MIFTNQFYSRLNLNSLHYIFQSNLHEYSSPIPKTSLFFSLPSLQTVLSSLFLLQSIDLFKNSLIY